jgi:tetratricopeptide (TPR) repeat protein
MSEDILHKAISMIKAGDRTGAKSILISILEKDPKNENAWLWLSSCADKTEEKIYCLQEALRINPNNEQAKKAIEQLKPRPIVGRDVIPASQPAIIVEQQLKPELVRNKKPSIEFIPAICPNCGGELRVPEDRKVIKCMYCGYDIIMRETQNNPPQSNVENWIKLAKAIVDTSPEKAYGYYTKVLEVEPENWIAWYENARIVERLSTLANPRITEIINCFQKAFEFIPDNEKEDWREKAFVEFSNCLSQFDQMSLLYLMKKRPFNENDLKDYRALSNLYFLGIDYVLSLSSNPKEIKRVAESAMKKTKNAFNDGWFNNKCQEYINIIRNVDPVYQPPSSYSSSSSKVSQSLFIIIMVVIFLIFVLYMSFR